MSVEDPALRARWSALITGIKTALTILAPAAAILAPILTGAYYLSLAGGSGSAARQMMMLSDPVNTALSLTVVFLPALAAALATIAVIVSQERFSLRIAASTVYLAIVMSGLNVDQGLWHGLGFLAALFLFLALAVPKEYPAAMLRQHRDRNTRVEYQSPWAVFASRRRKLHRTAQALAITTWTMCALATVTLGLGLFFTQLLSPQVYELRFSERGAPTQVVWFSTNAEGTWYLTSTTVRHRPEDAVFGSRDLEWTPLTPTAIVTCGLSASACAVVNDEGPTG